MTTGIAPTNGRIEFRGMDCNEIGDGKLARHQILYDLTDVSRQMGAAPKPGSSGERMGVRLQHLIARKLRKRGGRQLSVLRPRLNRLQARSIGPVVRAITRRHAALYRSLGGVASVPTTASRCSG